MNRVTLIGVLGSYSEFSVQSENNVAFCHAALSVQGERVDERGDARESQEWFRLLFYDEDAERFSVHAKRGKRMWVEGSMQTRPYADRAIMRVSIEIVVSDFRFLEVADNTD